MFVSSDLSTQKLASTGTEHRALNSSLGTGKALLSQLFARERTDQVLVVVALLVFVLTVVFIVKGRLFPSAVTVAPPPPEEAAVSFLSFGRLWSAVFGGRGQAPAADPPLTGLGRDEL